MRITWVLIIIFASQLWFSATAGRAAESKAPWQTEWDKTVEAAKKEGKIVAGIPASAELRKTLGD
ncbi:MAG: hypothetical protein ACXW6J_23705, partial [Candidatus Binatia bacterium]